MGHKRTGITSLYTHLFSDAFDGVEAALDRVLGVNEASTDSRVTTEQYGDRLNGDSPRNRATEPIAAA